MVGECGAQDAAGKTFVSDVVKRGEDASDGRIMNEENEEEYKMMSHSVEKGRCIQRSEHFTARCLLVRRGAEKKIWCLTTEPGPCVLQRMALDGHDQRTDTRKADELMSSAQQQGLIGRRW